VRLGISLQRDRKARLHVKVLKCHPIICIWPLQQRFKHCKILPRNQPMSRCVGYTEKDRKLFAADFRQVSSRRDGIHEAFWIQKPIAKDGRAIELVSQKSFTASTTMVKRPYKPWHSLVAIDFFSTRIKCRPPPPEFAFGNRNSTTYEQFSWWKQFQYRNALLGGCGSRSWLPSITFAG